MSNKTQTSRILNEEPQVIWAVVSKKTNRINAFALTRSQARQKKTEDSKVLRYVVDRSVNA